MLSQFADPRLHGDAHLFLAGRVPAHGRNEPSASGFQLPALLPLAEGADDLSSALIEAAWSESATTVLRQHRRWCTAIRIDAEL